MAFKFQRGFQYQRPDPVRRGPDWFQALTRVGDIRYHGGVGDEANRPYVDWESWRNPNDDKTGRRGTIQWLQRWPASGFNQYVGPNLMPPEISQFAKLFGTTLARDEAGNFYYEIPEEADEQGGSVYGGFYAQLTPEIARAQIEARQRQEQRFAARQAAKAKLRAERDISGETGRLAEILGEQAARGLFLPDEVRQAIFSGRAGWNDPVNVALRRAIQHGQYRNWIPRDQYYQSYRSSRPSAPSYYRTTWPSPMKEL